MYVIFWIDLRVKLIIWISKKVFILIHILVRDVLEQP